MSSLAIIQAKSETATAAALSPETTKNLQTCSATFAADIDTAEKGTITSTAIQQEIKTSSARKSSGPPETPSTKPKDNAEKAEGSIAGAKLYAQIYADVEGIIRELADQENTGGESILGEEH
jgi:hypothetical protein